MKGKWIAMILITAWIGCFARAPEILSAEKFPSRTITIYPGMAAGGGLFQYTRVMAEKMAEVLGVSVVVTAKPGAGGTIAADYVLRSKPDGYSIAVTIFPNICGGEYLLTKVGYKNTDFEYLGRFCVSETFMYVMSTKPWMTLKDLIDYAKQHPEELKYPSTSLTTQVKFDTLSKAAGIKLIHVPMKGETENIAAMVGGHCDVAEGWVTSILAMKDAGKMRLLAAFTEKRPVFFPEVPTFAELGYPQMNDVFYSTGYGMAVPKGTPKEVVDILRNAFAKAAQDKEVQDRLRKLGVSPSYLTGDQLLEVILRETKRFRQIYKQYNYEILNPE
jgi:tripartite-type tricarboxylate transporter receptor subunit TctC